MKVKGEGEDGEGWKGGGVDGQASGNMSGRVGVGRRMRDQSMYMYMFICGGTRIR